MTFHCILLCSPSSIDGFILPLCVTGSQTLTTRVHDLVVPAGMLYKETTDHVDMNIAQQNDSPNSKADTSIVP